MADITIRGIAFLINEQSSQVDKTGLVTATLILKPKTPQYIKVGEEGPQYGDEHPYDDRLTIEEISMEHWNKEGTVTVQYAGMDTSQLDETADAEQTIPVYNLTYGTTEEPIETHEDFATVAGTPLLPTSGAVFMKPDGTQSTADNVASDADKTDLYAFSRWETGTEHEGITHYLSPGGATYTESFTTNENPHALLNFIGMVDSPDFAPEIDNHEWLYVGMDYEQRGAVYSVTRTWKLSGPGGWSDVWYS
jgi:hypothetical protein